MIGILIAINYQELLMSVQGRFQYTDVTKQSSRLGSK